MEGFRRWNDCRRLRVGEHSRHRQVRGLRRQLNSPQRLDAVSAQSPERDHTGGRGKALPRRRPQRAERQPQQPPQPFNYAPGEYDITVATDPEKIPAPYTSNTAKNRTGIGSLDYEGYHYYQLVGDDTSGYVQVQVIPGTLTITPAYTQVNVTVAWKDSSNKDGIRPSAEDFAKYLTLTADGEPTDAQAVIVENGDTYNVVFDNVRKYAYDENGVRHEIAYQVTQANIDGYTTDNATVGNEGTITNTHEIAAAPAEKPSTEKPAAKKTSRKALPQTGDQSANALAIVALGATALGAAVVMKKRNEL